MGLMGGLDSLINDGREEESKRKSQRAIDQWNFDVPEFEDYNPEKYKYLGDYRAQTVDPGSDVVYEGVDPRLADIAMADRSEMDGISVDPRLKDQQMESLAALEEIAANGGMTAADKAALNKIQSEVGQADRGRRDAIKQNMAQRGMGGSGMELLQMLDSSQAATDRANQSGMDIAGMAQQRALDAILQGGNLAGDIRGQDFGEQAQIAQANDVINRFNAQNLNQGNQFNAQAMNQGNQFNANNALQNAQYNRDTKLGANQFNAQAQNQAGMFNTTNRQNTANANTDLSNQAQMQNKFVNPQQTFENQATKAAGKSGAYNQYANLMNQQAQQRSQGFAKAHDESQQAGQMIMSGMSMMSDERQKKDISHVAPEDLTEFLQAVQPKKFKYKDGSKPNTAEGDRIGFLLQDVQGTKLGKAITKKDAEGNMEYDKDNLNGILLAALSHFAKGA